MSTEKAREFIQPLVDLAFGPTGAAEAAAQVLLACYDGASYHLCIRDLCVLDPRHYQAALLVIRLRVEHGIEPQEVFEDSDPFPKLCEHWQSLHINHRGERQ